MSVFTITFLRHGETEANKTRVIQGQLDTELSDVGQRQAKLVGLRLQHEHFTHVFTSDLLRASMTAEAVLTHNKRGVPSGLVRDVKLRERMFGSMQGQPFLKLREAAMQASVKVFDYTPPGGETVNDLRQRAVSFFTDLCRRIVEDSNKLDNCSAQSTARREACDQDGRRTSCNDNKDSSNQIIDESINQHTDVIEGHLHASENSCNGVEVGGSGADSARSSGSSAIESPLESTHSIETVMSEESNHAAAQSQSSHTSDKTSGSEFANGVCNGIDVADSPLANVLVVSHGGLIRQFLGHLFDDLGCPLPASRHAVMHTTPNTGLSKFAVRVEDKSVRVSCAMIHDKSHLIEKDCGAPDGLV